MLNAADWPYFVAGCIAAFLVGGASPMIAVIYSIMMMVRTTNITPSAHCSVRAYACACACACTLLARARAYARAVGVCLLLGERVRVREGRNRHKQRTDTNDALRTTTYSPVIDGMHIHVSLLQNFAITDRDEQMYQARTFSIVVFGVAILVGVVHCVHVSLAATASNP